jgi:RNA polymerase sigma-70 factor, ECF subfamily
MNQPTFIQLIQKHKGIIHKVVFLYADGAEDRKDLYQEILYQAWKSVAHFEGRSQFSTWLYRVALNTALVFRRKDTKAGRQHSLEGMEYLPHELPINDDRSEWLLRAIRNLNDIDKTLITLHLEDYSNDEIADITGLTKNNVAVKLHRIKNALTNQLKDTVHG